MSESKKLANWAGTHIAKNTRSAYLTGAKKFLICLYAGNFEMSDAEFEALADRFVVECKNGRDWFKDLIKFAVSFEGSPPKTAKINMVGAKGFVEYVLDVEVSKKQLKKLKGSMPKGKRAWTVEGDLTKEKLRRILMHCDAKGNAFFMLLATSGIRVGEALKLNLRDVKLKSDPVKVIVHGANTKEGDGYYSFISSEAKEALMEWLKIRETYKRTAKNRGRGLSKLGDGKGVRKSDDPRLFPFSMAVPNSMWVRAIKKAKLDEKDDSTKRHKYHIHMLRKFFQTQMKYAGVPGDLVHALIGHSGYLSIAYDRFSPKQIVEWYLKGEPQLLLNVSAETQIIIEDEMGEQRQKIADLYRKLTDSNHMQSMMAMENKQLEKRVVALEKAFNTLAEMTPEQWRLVMQEGSRIQFQKQKEEDKKQVF